MAVSRCTITGIDYWKVYRRWGGKITQRYFRVDQPNERESFKKAEAEDESLRARQRAYMTRQVFALSYHLRDNGQIRGIRRVTRQRPGRKPAEAFEIRAKLPWEAKPHFNSVSIEKHGVDEAHALAVERYCDEYGFAPRSEMRSALRQTLGAYKTKLKLNIVPETVTANESDDEDWVAAMEKEIAEYKQRDRKTIIGR